MRAQPDGVDLVLTLPVDPGIDQVLREHATVQQELVIGLERVESLGERARHLLDVAALIASKRSKSAGSPGSSLLLDPVEAGHQHRGEREVRVRRSDQGSGTRAASPSASRGIHRDADARRAVALRVREVDGRLVAGHEPAVRVRRRERRTRAAPAHASSRPPMYHGASSREAGVAGGSAISGRAVLPERLVARACRSRCRRRSASA